MKIIRSWPRKPPDDHPRIFDNSERVYIPTVDYSPLLQLNDDVLHLDWDVAVGENELISFARKCQADPDQVRVAPTMSYSTRQRRWHKTTTTQGGWMVWNIESNGDRTRVEYGEPTCHLFSFGMVYLPLWAIAGFTRAIKGHPELWGHDANFRDVNFGYWHHHVMEGAGIPVEWETNAVHINYSINDVLARL